MVKKKDAANISVRSILLLMPDPYSGSLQPQNFLFLAASDFFLRFTLGFS